jgi:hypothetical protein
MDRLVLRPRGIVCSFAGAVNGCYLLGGESPPNVNECSASLQSCIDCTGFAQKVRISMLNYVWHSDFNVTLSEAKGITSYDRFFAESILSTAEGLRMTYWAKPTAPYLGVDISTGNFESCEYSVKVPPEG